MIAKIQNFIGEVFAEMKKVSWVTRQELWDSTLIVIASSLLLGAFLGMVDFILSKGIAHLLR
ncbi:MAG: preprotein translocase subunit SecE [Candidatus Omnitrophica bacterium]|nr:preprotein translocase subunit SecE [Candidatus Omnitrophota bacterium]